MKKKLTRNVRNPGLKCNVMLYHGVVINFVFA